MNSNHLNQFSGVNMHPKDFNCSFFKFVIFDFCFQSQQIPNVVPSTLSIISFVFQIVILRKRLIFLLCIKCGNKVYKIFNY